MSQHIIHRDNDTENVIGHKRQTKKDGLSSKQPLQSRQVLGNLANAPAARVQPTRAAKQQGLSSAGFGKVAQQSQRTTRSKVAKNAAAAAAAVNVQPTFCIFEDEKPSCSSKSTLPAAPVAKWEPSMDPKTQPAGTNAESQEDMDIFDEADPLAYAVAAAGPSRLSSEASGDSDQAEATKIKKETASYFNANVSNIVDMDASNDDVDLTFEEELGSYKKQLTAESRQSVIYFLPEYRPAIYHYIREAETRYMPRHDYMKKQTDITQNMRSILVDWLIEVAEEYKLTRETLCLSINYIDRFLSFMSVVRNKLQLLGAAAMFVAAKVEEIFPPDVGEFVFITDDTYTAKQVCQMEQLILKVLSFRMSAPTMNLFSMDLLHLLSADDKLSTLSNYLLELTLLDGETFMKFLPSVIATSSIYLANYILNRKSCIAGITEHTGYSIGDLKECTHKIFHAAHRIKSGYCPQAAVRNKYSTTKNLCVSETVLPSVLPLEAI